MARTQRAASTGGATGPRGDEPKESTTPGSERNHLMDTFDDVDIDLNGSVGETSTETEPQERRGLGLASVIGHFDDRPNASPNMDENDTPNPFYDGSDFMEDPKNLRAPEARDGFVQCWIEWFHHDGTVSDKVPGSMKRGWTPRNVNTVPARDAAFYQKRKNFDGGEMIVAHGMVLCEMPEEHMAQIEAWEKSMHQRNEAATLDPVRSANRSGSARGTNMRIGVTNTDD